MSNRLPLLLILLTASCGGAPAVTPPPDLTPPPPSSPAAALLPGPAPAPPSGVRLPGTVKPVRYSATLTIVPAEDTTKGAIDIDLSLGEPAQVIWLNGTELTVDAASLEVGGKKIAARAVPGGDDFIGFALAEQAPKGPARLHVDYRGKISTKDDRGVFMEQEGDGLYVFTQFENIEARSAFPCFDEPAYKVPWQLTLRVKEGDVALSNTPVLSESAPEAGMKTVRFAETKPLPSYLVAFAVGPFELVDGGRAGKKNTPIRIVTPRGQKAEATYAAVSTGQLLAEIENFFGIPYPYEKLDVVAIPRLASFGAMENAGLITHFKTGMLAKPEEDTIAFKRRYVDIITHEIAHQWFGDLVTMAWWDDIWLNEAFATWMESKILTRWKPEWAFDASHQRGYAFAMGSDSLISARRIRQRVDTKDDIQNAFDGITYQKGSAVIDMFESFLGAEKFRKGVQRYLNRHAFGNATAADFFVEVSAEAGRDVAPAFSTFLDQPGVPLVSADLKCDKGSKPKVELSQERYLPIGSKGKANAATWQIPVCVRYPIETKGKKVTEEACTLLSERAASLELAKADRCPAWVMPNARAAGYYRVAYKPDALAELWKSGAKQLTLVERIRLIDDTTALMRNGKLGAAAGLARLPELAKDPSPHILRSAVDMLFSMRDPYIPEALGPNWSRFIEKTLGPKAREIGWKAKPGEDEQIRLIRPNLLSVVADKGDDKALLEEALALAQRWLDDPRAVDNDVVDGVISVAAHRGDQKLFDRLHEGAKKNKDQVQRGHLIGGMSQFRDPAIVKQSLSILLRNELDARETAYLFFQDERMADVTFSFLKQNFDAVIKGIPAEIGSFLPFVAGNFCDEAHRADVEAFFKDRVTKITGGAHNLAQVLEGISLCTALRDAHQASLAAFLKKY